MLNESLNKWELDLLRSWWKTEWAGGRKGGWVVGGWWGRKGESIGVGKIPSLIHVRKCLITLYFFNSHHFPKKSSLRLFLCTSQDVSIYNSAFVINFYY